MAITSSGWTQRATTGTWKSPQIVRTSQGFLAVYLNDTAHAGKSVIASRTSTDLITWSAESIVATDADNDIGTSFPGVVVIDEDNIAVWCYKRRVSTAQPLSNGYSTSTDGGATWSGYTSRGDTLTGLGYGSRLACSVTPVTVDGTHYLPHYAGPNLGNLSLRLYATDGIDIDAEYTPVSDATAATLGLTEWAVAYGDGLWVVIARYPALLANNTGGVYITTSSDLTAWSTPEKVNLPEQRTWTHPNVIYKGGRFYYLTGDRDAADFSDNKLWVYSSTAARLTESVSDWTQEASFDRPSGAHADFFYGYPQTLDLLDDRVLVHVLGEPGGDETAYYATLSGFPALTATPEPEGVQLDFPDGVWHIERRVV